MRTSISNQEAAELKKRVESIEGNISKAKWLIGIISFVGLALFGVTNWYSVPGTIDKALTAKGIADLEARARSSGKEIDDILDRAKKSVLPSYTTKTCLLRCFAVTAVQNSH
jgi:hypothetical protein